MPTDDAPPQMADAAPKAAPAQIDASPPLPPPPPDAGIVEVVAEEERHTSTYDYLLHAQMPAAARQQSMQEMLRLSRQLSEDLDH